MELEVRWYVGVDWIRVAHDGNLWSYDVKTVMKLPCYTKTVDAFTPFLKITNTLSQLVLR